MTQNLSKVSVTQLILVSLCGLVFAAGIIYVLMAIAVPAYNNYLMPQSQYDELMASGKLIMRLSAYQGVMAGLGLLFSLVLFWTLATIINPLFGLGRIRTIERRWRAVTVLVVSVLLLLIAFSNGALLRGNIFQSSSTLNYFIYSVLFAGVWFLLSPRGLGRFYKSDALPGKRDVIRCLLFGAGFGLFVAAVTSVYSHWVNSYIVFAIDALDPSLEASLYGWKLLITGVAFFTVVMLLCIYASVPLFQAETLAWHTRLSVGAKGVAALALVVAGLLVLQPVLSSRYQVDRKSMVQAAGLQNVKPDPISLIRLCADQRCYSKSRMQRSKVCNGVETRKLDRYITSSGMFVSSKPYPLSAAVVPKLEAFVSDKSHSSIYKKSAINAIGDVYMHLLRPTEYYAAQRRLLSNKVTGDGRSLLALQIHLHWLSTSAPLTAENRAALMEYIVPGKYRHSGKATRKLARALVRFGLSREAQKVFASYKPEKHERVKEEKPVLLLPEVVNGSIAGQVRVAGVDPSRIRVVFFRAKTIGGKVRQHVLPGFYAFPNVTANVAVDRAGRFRVRHLTGGYYGISLLVDSEKFPVGNVIQGKNITGLIKVDRKTPHISLPQIELNATHARCGVGGKKKAPNSVSVK